MKSHWLVLLMSGLLAGPAFADHGGGRGGGGFHGGVHAGGGGFHGGVHAGAGFHAAPRAGVVVHAPGVYHAGVRGPYVRGPYGGRAVYGRGVYYRRPGFSRPFYNWGGRRYVRPLWAPGRIDVYRRGFYGYPGFHAYSNFFGLVPPLVPYAGLAFLSAGLLTASYLADGHTVYVYVVNQDGVNVEYRVDDAGNILSQQVLP